VCDSSFTSLSCFSFFKAQLIQILHAEAFPSSFSYFFLVASPVCISNLSRTAVCIRERTFSLKPVCCFCSTRQFFCFSLSARFHMTVRSSAGLGSLPASFSFSALFQFSFSLSLSLSLSLSRTGSQESQSLFLSSLEESK